MPIWQKSPPRKAFPSSDDEKKGGENQSRPGFKVEGEGEEGKRREGGTGDDFRQKRLLLRLEARGKEEEEGGGRSRFFDSWLCPYIDFSSSPSCPPATVAVP